MNKYLKWGIVGTIIAGGAIYLGINTFIPKVNKELEAAPVKSAGKQARALNVKAVILRDISLGRVFCKWHAHTRRAGRPVVRDFGQDNRHFFRRGHIRQEGRAPGKNQRCTATSRAKEA